ncbi:MAG: signal peptidase II [Candidatus Woesearchaeota archaeon]
MNQKNKKSTELNKFLIISLTAVGILLLDQLTKLAVIKNMELLQSIPVLQNILHLTYIQNTGAGFGLFSQSTRLLIWFSIIVIGLIFYFYEAIPDNKCMQLSIAAILGGAIGNLIDRIKLGYVIDFIDFKIWPAFNIADMAIVIGVISIAIFIIKKEIKEKK